MILVDTNLLVYAGTKEAPKHESARDWLDARLAETPRVGLPWPSLLGYVRIVANPRAVQVPVPLPDAWRRVRAWIEQPSVWIPRPTEGHAAVLGPLLEREAGHNLVPDAHLAALAIEHGLILCTADRGFARFPGLRWENPLDAVR